MEYRVEEIARAAGVGIDTVRFYQTRGLLPAPARRGRTAIYTDAHLERLRRIRRLNRQGLTLEAVGRILEGPDSSEGVKESLLGALAESEGKRTFTRSELAREAGVPDYLIESGEQAGLLQPLEAEGPAHYTETDLHAVESAKQLLESGFPLHELVPLARDHAAHTREIVDRAIELFDRYVRSGGPGRSTPDSATVAGIVRRLLPAATTLVALHFQRTLTHRARARLVGSGEDEALEAALEATREGQLKVSWR